MSTTTPRKRKERPDNHDGTETHGSTLFVSNLPYSATSTDLQTLFSDIAPVRSAFVVLDKASGVSKGVGYVAFAIKDDAQEAFDKIGKEKISLVGRKLRVQWAGKKPKEGEVVDRPAARASMKVRNQPEPEEEGPEDEDVDMVAAQESSLEGSSHESDSDDDIKDSDDDGDLGVHKDEGSDEENGDDVEAPVKPHLPPPEAGTTLFVRNVPFTATEDELRLLFRAFGPLRYARITMDAATGRTRGTGFACFWNKEDADKAVEQSELLRQQTTGGAAMPKKNPFTLPSILTPDPSSSLAHNLVLHGRTLDVVRAVTRDQACKLKEDGEKKREKADNRNMYLLREGVILPNTPAAETLTPAEIEKRTTSYNSRRTMLRSNPSLYVSKTRLSVRQIPIFVTERLLKRLAIHAVRAFESDVKKCSRPGLTKDELAEVEEGDGDEKVANEEKGADVKGKRIAGRRTGVKQAKIVRQQERVDPVTGKGRSKGYGFVEMHKHSDALRVLRWANNNPDTGRIFAEWRKDELQDLVEQEKAKEVKDEARIKRLKEELEKGVTTKNKGTLIVEFSIENVQVVQRRSARQTEKRPEEQTTPPEKVTKTKTKTDERVAKKRRVSEETTPKPVAAKEESGIRSLIGRKRKERRAGKKNPR